VNPTVGEREAYFSAS